MGKFFLFDNQKIHFTDSGKGDVIVLLHGYLESAEIWGSFAEILSGDFRVISVDLPGHGFSEISGTGNSMEYFADMLKALLDYLKVKKIFLTGHSLGGYVALAFLERYSFYLAGYCLFHSQPLADGPEAISKREREIAIVSAGKKDLIYQDNVTKMYANDNLEKYPVALKRSASIASTVSAQGIISVLKGMMARPSRLSVMEKGEVPCLWILGLKDNYIPCEAIQTKVNLPSNAKVVILPESGHMGFIEEKGKSAELITEFVRKLTF
jgi:pimeloyl-ACP methyl ester carboxylesterase